MASATAHKKWKYDLHPSVRMAQSVIAGMKEKTGRSIEEWIRFTRKEGPSEEKERAEWLKKRTDWARTMLPGSRLAQAAKRMATRMPSSI